MGPSLCLTCERDILPHERLRLKAEVDFGEAAPCLDADRTGGGGPCAWATALESQGGGGRAPALGPVRQIDQITNY